MRVLLVDDSALFLEALRDSLELHEISVCGTASSARQGIEEAALLRPDAILMDIQMPGISGIEATRQIKDRFPSIRILLMTVSKHDEHLFEGIAAGADGYLLKHTKPEGFVAALHSLEAGETPLSPGLAAKILAEFSRRQREAQTDHSAALNDLTDSQRRILQLVAQGLTYKEVALHMNLAERTIKYHMGEIADRLHLENRAQAIAFASQHLRLKRA